MNSTIRTIAIATAGCIALMVALFAGYKQIQVWSAAQNGKAVLAEAEFSRQARIEEARAKKAAAELEGEAELTRAEFAAKANAALRDSLGGNEAYLRYMFIRMLEEQGNAGNIIYIPTEAGMPVLEAGRGTRALPMGKDTPAEVPSKS